jgi:hypothetical protein
MRFLRRRAAANLLGGNATNHELSEVLDFYAGVAFLYDVKAIDRDLAYRQFSWWLIRWFEAAHAHIEQEKVRDPTCWKTLAGVAKVLRAAEAKAGCTDDYYEGEQLRQFLCDEAGLMIVTQADLQQLKPLPANTLVQPTEGVAAAQVRTRSDLSEDGPEDHSMEGVVA